MALPSMPSKPVTPADTSKKTSEKGPHGGGNTFHQLAVGKDFAVHNPFPGHTQKQNVKKNT